VAFKIKGSNIPYLFRQAGVQILNVSTPDVYGDAIEPPVPVSKGMRGEGLLNPVVHIPRIFLAEYSHSFAGRYHASE
jgi:hypothetical protein